MGILDAPGLSGLTLGRSLRAQGLTLVSTGTNGLNSGSGRGGGAQGTYRIEHYAAVSASGLRLVFGNWYAATGIGGAPNPSPVLVKAALERLSPNGSNFEDQPRIPVTFAGQRYGVCSGSALLISDPIPFRVAKGERFFSRTSVSANLFGANTLAAPTLTVAAAGGALPTGSQFQVACSIVYPAYESLIGTPAQSTATTTAASQITVTSPTAVAGALGYRVWATSAAGSTSSPFYVVSEVVPFGTDYVWKYPVNTASPTQSTTAGGGGVGVPQGKQTLGGTSFFGLDNGEGNTFLADLVDDGGGTSIQHITATAYSPIGILGSVGTGPVLPSVAQSGDSIQSGIGDGGLQESAQGGALRRAIDGITTRTTTSSFVPAAKYGLVSAGPIPGEKLANFLTANGQGRIKAAQLASTVVSNYSINDVPVGAGLLMANIVAEANLYIPAGIKFIQETLLPKTTSTDGWRSLGSQATVTGTEIYRQAINAWIRSNATAGTPVTNEVPTNNAVNGTNRGFCPLAAFVQGSETVKVNGTTTTAYVYSNPTYLADGTKIAGGITFTTAPTNGSAVTISYTPIPGFKTAVGSANPTLVDVFDVAAQIEVDSAGNYGTAGGLWAAPPAGSIDTGTITAVTSKSLTDSSKSWTSSGGAAAGFKGYVVRITADAATPASVGQVLPIAYNSGTVLTSVTSTWGVTPSVGASYEIFAGYTIDGLHPSSDGYVKITPAIDLTKIA